MSEEEARDWVRARFGLGATERLDRFADMLAAAAGNQNLIARPTLDAIWSRHLTDSAQLAELDQGSGAWLDIGTGGGMPGLVLALILDRSFTRCAPRRRRAAFLQSCVDAFGIAARVTVLARRVEAAATTASVISARAVASVDALKTAARHCATRQTTWILPRGKSGADEVHGSVMLARGEFHVKQSVTDPDAIIVVARGIGAP